MNIGQPEIATAVAISQSFVIQSHEMQHGGMQVMDVHPVFDGLISELVGRAERHAPANAAAGEPHGETACVVITTFLDRKSTRLNSSH